MAPLDWVAIPAMSELCAKAVLADLYSDGDRESVLCRITRLVYVLRPYSSIPRYLGSIAAASEGREEKSKSGMIYCTSSEDCVLGIDIEVLSTDTFTYQVGTHRASQEL